MNNHKAAVLVLNQADTLKAKLLLKWDLLNEPGLRITQHQLQTIYHQVLVLDLEYALDKKVEQELWTFGFKHYISALQEITRDKKNPRRSEAQALLTSCLQSASGFYLSLLQELYTRFNIDVPFRTKGTYGQIKSSLNSDPLIVPHSSSCTYICQYCLVHLGDIARYMNKRAEAESFYKQAIRASPTSGHPYNQLALLEANQGDKLSTVFHYVRGIAVKNPFPATATNLANTFSSVIDKEEPVTEIQTKMSVNDFTRLFLQVHGFLHSFTELEQADLGVKSINATLTALVATQSFTANKLIKMTVINLFALRQVVDAGCSKSEELTKDEQKVKELILDLLSGSLSAFLLPVYTLKTDMTLLDYYALPAIKLIFYWIIKEPEILKENVFASKLQIWPSFCKLLNHLQTFTSEFESDKYLKLPLWEDRELHGFLPLQESFKELDFTIDHSDNGAEVEQHVRAKRLINFGFWLAESDVYNTKYIIRNTEDLIFEPGCIQPDPTDKLLEEMKSIGIAEKTKKTKEKRGGILKPQGSLEKAREEREQVLLSAPNSNGQINNLFNSSSKNESTKLKRVKQNVALQSIFKKIEENKQVKFSSETADNEKEKYIKIKPVTKTPVPVAQTVQQFRPQFNPPPMLSTPPEPQDLLNSRLQNRPCHPETNTNVIFPSNEIPKSPKVPFPMLSQQVYFNSLQNVPSFQPPNNSDNQTAFNPYSMQYNNKVPYQNRSFNTWASGNEDRQAAATWWPNQMQQQNTNFPLQNSNYSQTQNTHNYMQPKCENYQPRFPFPPSMAPPTNANMPMNLDFNKRNQNDPIGTIWNNPQRTPIGNEGLMGLSNINHNLTVRQAMLNETKQMPSMATGFNQNSTGNNYIPATSPGYSLFNPSGWSPNLPAQIRSHVNTENSLFTNQGPQSLKQLLEQQNQLQKDDT